MPLSIDPPRVYIFPADLQVTVSTSEQIKYATMVKKETLAQNKAVECALKVAATIIAPLAYLIAPIRDPGLELATSFWHNRYDKVIIKNCELKKLLAELKKRSKKKDNVAAPLFKAMFLELKEGEEKGVTCSK